MKLYNISIVCKNENIIPCKIAIKHMRPYVMKVDSDLISKEYTGRDLVECLDQFRGDIEAKNCLVVCNGARVDAHATAMSRDMGAGRMLFILEIGKQLDMNSKVHIFGAASPEQVGTIEQQRSFLEQWRRSLQ